jgi:hypothetical protein
VVAGDSGAAPGGGVLVIISDVLVND